MGERRAENGAKKAENRVGEANYDQTKNPSKHKMLCGAGQKLPAGCAGQKIELDTQLGVVYGQSIPRIML